MEMRFDHERLEVYQVARQFNRRLRSILDGLPRGSAESKGNLERAAKSVTRNIAEGSGKWKISDKIHYYHIARGSATESAACLDELVDLGLVPEAQTRAPKEVLARIVAMLTAMIRSLEARGGADMA